MSTPLRVLLARVAIGLLLAGLIVAVTHHDRPSQIITTGTPLQRPTSTTTTSTTVPPSTTAAPVTEPSTTVVRATTTTVVPDPPPTSSSDVEAAIAGHFPDLYRQARAVANCESTLDPTAVSKDRRNWGLFQLNVVHRGQFADVTGRPWSEVLDPNLNAMFARWLYDQEGWGPWACRWAAR